MSQSINFDMRMQGILNKSVCLEYKIHEKEATVVCLGLDFINGRKTLRDFEESNDNGALKEDDAGSSV